MVNTDIDNEYFLTLKHRDIIFNKKFLKKIYLNWYKIFSEEIENLNCTYLEIGSGGGFFKQICPEIITSDKIRFNFCDMTFSAEKIPFEDNSVKGIFLLNVFHHINNPEKFLYEANRVLKKGGFILMIEPTINVWSKFIYRTFHHETIDLNAKWLLKGNRRLSDANIAASWIVFKRDFKIFQNKFQYFKINFQKNHSPFIYLLSGGLSNNFSFPGWSFTFFYYLEKIFYPFKNYFSMFQTIKITKLDS